MNLVAFSGSETPYTILAMATMKASLFHVTFQLEGPIDHLKKITDKCGPADRQNELWKTTCFEWFLKPAQEAHYWECNLSPTGEWNLYRLDNYRENLQEEKSIPRYTSMTTILTKNQWQMDCRFDLSPLKLSRGRYKVNLSAVLETLEGEKSYWSLAHTQKQPDFHHSQHFVLDVIKEI